MLWGTLFLEIHGSHIDITGHHYSCPFLKRKTGPDNLQSTLPTSINPLFCDFVYLDTPFLTASFLRFCEKFCLTNSLCSMPREKSFKHESNIHSKHSRLFFPLDNDSGDLHPTLNLSSLSRSNILLMSRTEFCSAYKPKT